MLEEQPIGTKLTQLQASDEDSNIEAYHMSTNDYLAINNLTGKRAALHLCRRHETAIKAFLIKYGCARFVCFFGR